MGHGNPVAVPVEAENLGVWQEPLEWHFSSFCRGEKWTPDELWADCAEKKRQLWVVWDDEPLGAVLTMVSGDTLVLTHASGRDRRAWLPLWVVLEGYARGIGLTCIEAVCRVGWERDLKRLGLTKTHVIMEKRL